ncbi:synaptobrevin, WD40/YVTN repeat-like-containing domain protein, partial [Tanacetum coccineum]
QKQTQVEGLKCSACFQILDSPVQALQYVDHGAKLAVAYECGRVAVLDMNEISVSFLTDSLPNPSSPVISMTCKSFVYNGGHVKSPKGARPKDLDKPVDKLMFVCTKDATLYVYDGYDYRTLNSKPVQLKKDTTAISMQVIGEYFRS